MPRVLETKDAREKFGPAFQLLSLVQRGGLYSILVTSTEMFPGLRGHCSSASEFKEGFPEEVGSQHILKA